MSDDSKHFEGGAAVLVAVMGETLILLIRETTKPLPHFWKLPGETVEKGEPIINAVLGAVREEACFADLCTGIDPSTKTLKANDPRVHAVKELAPPEWVESRRPHWRHLWGVLTTDEVIKSLSGRHFSHPTEKEEIDTGAFPLANFEYIPNIMRTHVQVIRSIPRHVTA